MAMTPRKPAFFLRELNTGVSTPPELICCGKMLRIWLIRFCCAVESRRPMVKPTMAMMAIRIGKMAVMRLNASPAAKFITQSLLNLVKNACKDLTSFLAVCLAAEESWCSVLVDCTCVLVAIAIFLNRHFKVLSLEIDAL